MNSLIRFSPTHDMRRLQREIDGLFEGFFPTQTQSENGNASVWTPRVDLTESDDAYFIHLDLPGMKKEDLEINFEDGTLAVSGERRAEQTEDNRRFVRVERSYGRFYRAFTLPQAVDLDRVEARFENGVLHITVPKSEEVKPRRIDIQ
ncbi:MAG: Hsp20/alpha crystallin family protein [Rhodothermales bacterium]|nr:Hsp20/alpha crystallin family protein [Rhodothermales bacterium]